MTKIDTAKEMTVVTKAKKLYDYIVVVTEKAPRRFRFSLSAELMRLGLNVIKKIYQANEIFIDGTDDCEKKLQLRKDYQMSALTDVKLLGYIAMLATDHKCIVVKQYEFMSKYVSECQCLLGAWIKSDAKRFGRDIIK